MGGGFLLVNSSVYLFSFNSVSYTRVCASVTLVSLFAARRVCFSSPWVHLFRLLIGRGDPSFGGEFPTALVFTQALNGRYLFN